MTFIERIESFLLSEDVIIQDFVLHALHDYPGKKRSWNEQLVREAIKNEEKRTSILIYLAIDPMHEELVSLLVEGANQAPIEIQHIYSQVMADIAPEIALKNKQTLSPFIPKDTWDLYELVGNGTEEEVKEVYQSILMQLNNGEGNQSSLYNQAKKVAFTLVKKEWITEAEINRDFEASLLEEWFDFKGILTVYMIGLIKNQQYIHKLAPLLVRDDDILLDEVAATLITFQTDGVVEAVSPYINMVESNIYATSIIENIKTDLAIQVLRDAYHQADDEDVKATIIEALAHQLSVAAEPEISDYVSKRPTTFLYEVEELAYSYYKMIGINHPLLKEWKATIEGRNDDEGGITTFDQPVSIEKVGRNEPCPCGSGKKHKKCCG